MSRIRFKSKQPLGLGGRVFGSLFFLVFFAMGALFCVFIGREFFLNLQIRNWPTAECVIIESQVTEDRSRDETPYKFAVRYEYQWQGKAYSSTKWSRQNAAFSDYSKAQRLARVYGLDTKATCYVDPTNPQSAVLERPSLWIGLVVLLPLIFVAIGLGGIIGMWRVSSPSAKPEEIALSSRPTIAAQSRKVGKGVAFVFFGIFLLGGVVASYFALVGPVLNVLQARSWPATRCMILSSQVQSHRGDSTTYSMDVLYSYEVNGREFRSNRHSFMGGSSSGHKGKAAIAARYQPGSSSTCYVNPSDPSEAVLERGFTATMWIGLIPLVFVLVGVGGIIGTLRSGNRIPSDASPYEPMSMRQITGNVAVTSSVSFLDEEPASPRVLKSSSSRLAAVIGIGIFAAIWNGVIFFGFILNSGFFRRGRTDFFDWFGILFMIPFVAIGLFMIGLLVYQILGLFNPKATVTITPGAPALGEKLTLSWQLSGRTHVLRGLKIFVEAREEATYRRGTSTSTDRKTFLKLDVHHSAGVAALDAGESSIALPENSVPSWKSTNNKIVWVIHVVGEIPRWPDLKEEFVIEVRAPRAKVSA